MAKDWMDYLATVHYVYVRTDKRGCRIYRSRTKRGMDQLTRNWMRKYPQLFTKEAKREMLKRKGGAPMKSERKQRYTRTKKQREFRMSFWLETNFEFMDDTLEPFNVVARRQINWYLTNAQETHRKLEDEFLEMETNDAN